MSGFIWVCKNGQTLCSEAPTLHGHISLNIEWILTKQKRIETSRRGALICAICILFSEVGFRVLGESLVELPTAFFESAAKNLAVDSGFCTCLARVVSQPSRPSVKFGVGSQKKALKQEQRSRVLP